MLTHCRDVSLKAQNGIMTEKNELHRIILQRYPKYKIDNIFISFQRINLYFVIWLSLMKLSIWMTNFLHRCGGPIHIFLSIKPARVPWPKYSWVNRSPDGSALNLFRLTLLKKIVNITCKPLSCAFLLKSLHLGLLQTYDQTGISQEALICH
jgi:hypothetical protein